MFNCEVCGRTTKHGEKCNLIVADQKMVQHPWRSGVNKIRNPETDKIEYTPDPGGKGYQIVKEIRACGDCKTFSPLLAKKSTFF